MESFGNPEQELSMSYRIIHEDVTEGKIYIEAIVFEKTNNSKLIKIDYILGNDALVISNVVSFRNDKPMTTSSGQQTGATDVGSIAIKWIYKQILIDAENRGYKGVRITSSTRYSGARAKNGLQTSIDELPINYSVDQKITERFVYNLEDGVVYLL